MNENNETLYRQLTKEGWIQTDMDCNQYRKELSSTSWIFREDRISDPETNETYVYESEIHLSAYSQIEMFDNVRSFGYSLNEMSTWIDEGENLSLIAECIFEME